MGLRDYNGFSNWRLEKMLCGEEVSLEASLITWYRGKMI